MFGCGLKWRSFLKGTIICFSESVSKVEESKVEESKVKES